jgi:hypothetical protein
VGIAPDLARLQRPHRCRPIESLDLGLLINGQLYGPLR